MSTQLSGSPQNHTQGYSALVLGASGLVGKALTQMLVKDPRYKSVTCLVRRPMSSQANIHHPVVIDFDNLQAYEGYFRVDHLYICLGTTLKAAGSKSEFRKVDFEYVHIAAQPQSAGAQSGVDFFGRRQRQKCQFLSAY